MTATWQPAELRAKASRRTRTSCGKGRFSSSIRMRSRFWFFFFMSGTFREVFYERFSDRSPKEPIVRMANYDRMLQVCMAQTHVA